MKKDCVLFWDFDGTLAYSLSLWSGSMFKSLKLTDPNTSVPFDAIKRCMASGFPWHTPNEDYRAIVGESWWEHMNKHFYASFISCGVPPDVAALATGRIREIVKQKENYTLYDDTIEVLKRLKKSGYQNIVLSNNYPDLEEVMASLGLKEYFDGVVVSGMEGYDKPRMELFEIAKRRYPASTYYMIGDSINADIQGGKNAGMKTILVHCGDSTQADYCFDDLQPITEMLATDE